MILARLIQNPLFPGHCIFDRTGSNSFAIAYQIHRGFTEDEETLIRKALSIVADRLCNEAIVENMYRICGTSGCLFGAGVWARSQLAEEKVYRGLHNLLRFQLACLKELGEHDRFPLIHIYPINEKTDTQAEGTIGCVSCVSFGSTFSTIGEFRVKLNRYNLHATDHDLYWAGAIVHEMLHNLGHKHQRDDYTDQWQMNVFEQCFVHNGNYAP